MTTHLITFSDSSMSRSAELCIKSAQSNGIERHSDYSPESVSGWSSVRENPTVFRQPQDSRRAWSWWAFKPLIIKRELDRLPDNSILIYSDAGVEFIDNVNRIIDRMDQDIFLFGNQYEHAHWCKRDIISAVWPAGPWKLLSPWPYFGKQVQASVIFFRVNDRTRAFVKEWLDWCLFEGGRLIDDSPSRLPNHPEFQENRHDQAILTTMAYRDGIRLHWWPAVYNDGAFTYPKGEYTDDYPPLFHHHRRRNHEWSSAA